MNLKKRIAIIIALSSIGIFGVLVVLYEYINHVVVLQEVEKARLMSKLIYYYREYLSGISPYIKTENNASFSCTPAYVTNQVAKLLRDKERLYIRQVSDRYRSSMDKPNIYELKAIEYFKKNPSKKELWEIHSPHKNIKMGGDVKHIFYAYPLYIEKSCLVCHGKPYKDVPKELYEVLVKKYGNRAFNYKIGELRGILSIRLPYQKAKNNIISFFLFIGTILAIAFIVGTIMFFGLTKKVTDDIDKILNFFKKLKENKSKLNEELNFEEFNELKKEINTTIDKINEYENKLIDKLYYHPLTKLLNRVSFFEYTKLHKKPIILINVDKFKEINSYYGIGVADKLILQIASRLKRLNLPLFHIRIDEFALVVDERNKKELENFAKLVLKELEKPYIIDDYEIMVRFRAGISYIKNDYISAEMALSKAKELKKDIAFDTDIVTIKNSYGKNLNWLKKLKKVIEKKEIIPYYQPIVDKDKNIVRYEALVRVANENMQIENFLQTARNTRYYVDVAKIMFEKIFEVIKNKKANISINLTLEDIENKDIRKFLLEKIRKCPYKENITFEIVENEDIKKSKIAKRFLENLKKEKIKIYIDDFGSGYANFDYLLKLHPDGVKIDGSLIKDILNDKNSQIMLKTLISFAKEMDIKIVAEYVENEKVFELLKNMGVDYFQGYYISKPMPDIKEENANSVS